MAVTTPFDWSAPSECPSASEVQAEVERHLGTPLPELAITQWSVEGTITGDRDRGWTLDLAIETPDGSTRRTLRDPSDCTAVSDAGALLTAMALDPGAFASAVDPATSGLDAGPTEAEVTEVARAEQPPDERNEPDAPPPPRLEPKPPEPEASPRRVPLLFVLLPSGGFDWGTLRGVSPIGRLDVAWRLPRVRAGLTATFGVAPGFPVPSVDRDASLWMWTVGVDAGPVFRVGKFEFPLTAGLEAGQIVIRPRELLDPSRQQVTWAALLLTPGAAWVPLPWLAVVVRVGTTVSFVRPSFALEGIGRIAAPAPVGIRATLGLEFRFGLTVMKTGTAGNE